MLQSLAEVAKGRGGEEAQGDVVQREQEGEDVQMEAQEEEREPAEVQIHQTEAGNTEIQPEEESDDNDRWIQGEVAPPLTKKEQEEMAKKGIFLVVATNVVGDIFVTQLAEKYYTKKEQEDIRRKGGQLLISRTEETHDVYNMSKELDASIFPKQSQSRGATATASTGASNVAVSQSDQIQREPEGTISEMLEELPPSEESSAKESTVGSPRG